MAQTLSMPLDASAGASGPVADAALDQARLGFDGRPPPASSRAARLWRIGRWLRVQGARRPTALRIVHDDAVIVDGRILAIDGFGDIQDLSTTRRVPSPQIHWKRR